MAPRSPQPQPMTLNGGPVLSDDGGETCGRRGSVLFTEGVILTQAFILLRQPPLSRSTDEEETPGGAWLAA